jgi:hypothetical protein
VEAVLLKELKSSQVLQESQEDVAPSKGIASTQYQSTVTVKKWLRLVLSFRYTELTSQNILTTNRFIKKFRRERIYFMAFNAQSVNVKGKVDPVLNCLRN